MTGHSLDRALKAGYPRARWMGAGIAAGVLVAAAVSSVLAVRSGSELQPGLMLALVLVGLAGAFLVTRRPAHAIAWVLSAAGIVGAVAALSAGGIPTEIEEPNAWQVAAMLAGGLTWFAFLFLMLVLLPLWFPTGRPPSPRWRWVTWTGSLSLVGFLTLWLLQEEFCFHVEAGECTSSVRNPLGISGVVNPEYSAVGGLFFGAILICAIAATVSLVVRFRRAAGMERQQVKWLIYSVALLIGSILVLDVLLVETLDLPQWPAIDVVQDALWVAIPLSIVIAVLRYRLYEIDRIISRTVSYALLTALLVGVYVGGVFGLGSVVRSVSEESGPPVVAASTLLVAAVFTPLRKRIQSWVDRRFNRARYDAGRAIEDFAAQLKTQVALDDISSDLAAVVVNTINPSRLALWLRPGATG